MALRAESGADARVEHAQKVLYLSDGSHGGSRVVASGFLADRDRWREACQQVDVGFGKLADKLPRVGREALEVAALAFGVKRVEGQRAFAAAADAGEADELVSRQDQIDALEIVFASAANDDRQGVWGVGRSAHWGRSLVR